MANKDPYFNLKYVAYCQSMMPPEGVDINADDFVIYCKRRLCNYTKVLMKDPVWDEYTNEEIMVEYFSYLFMNNKDALSKIEGLIRGEDPDLMDWFDKKIAENQEEVKNLIDAGGDDHVSFTPDDVLGDDNG